MIRGSGVTRFLTNSPHVRLLSPALAPSPPSICIKLKKMGGETLSSPAPKNSWKDENSEIFCSVNTTQMKMRDRERSLMRRREYVALVGKLHINKQRMLSGCNQTVPVLPSEETLPDPP